jgi:hypothetical protein
VGPPAEPALAELITRCADGSLAVREQVLLHPPARADADDLPQLIDALEKAPDTRSRTRVARVIARIGTDACVEPLEHCLLHDESEHARASAAQALGDLRNRRAVGPLVRALATDDTARVRKSAATALGRIGGAFVQRFVLAHPDRVTRACAGGPNPLCKNLDGLDSRHTSGRRPWRRSARGKRRGFSRRHGGWGDLGSELE